MVINILSSTIIILNVSVVSFAFHSRHLQHHQGRCRKSHDSNVSQARVAIGFFGISRNLSSAVESIERHAFDVLHRSNIRYCDITAHTVLLYLLFCLIYMYCTLYVLYILYTVHTVHVPCFPVSDVEVSPSTSVHTLVHLYTISIHLYISSLFSSL